MSRKPTRIQSIARACKVLLFIAENSDGKTAADTAREFGLSSATAYHILNTLVAEGFLHKDSAKRYHLGPLVGVLADALGRDLAPPEDLLRGTRILNDKTSETAYLSAWRNGEIVVLSTVDGHLPVRAQGPSTGFTGDAHARASGKLLLAHASPRLCDEYLATHPMRKLTASTTTERSRLMQELERVRTQGFAMDEEEFREGVACIAAPITANGTVIGAYTVSAPVDRFRRRLDELKTEILAAADAASESTAVS